MGRLRTRVERLEQLDQGGGLPDQSGHAGEFLTTNGTDSAWAPIPGGGGTVTSVGVTTGSSGVSVTGSPVTGSGVIDLALGTAAAAATTDFDAAGDAAAAEAAANAYTDAAVAGLVESVTGVNGVTVDNTDPQNPIVSSEGAAKAPGATFGTGSLSLTGTIVIEIPRLKYGGTITGWRITGDGSVGSASITVYHATYAAWPTLTTLFTATCSSQDKDDDTGLSHAVSAGDVLRFEASGFANWTRCGIVLDMT